MKKNPFQRILALVLALTLLFGISIQGISASSTGSLSFRKVENLLTNLGNLLESAQDTQLQYADTDIVRVSIVLEAASVLEAGYSTIAIAENSDAMAYRQTLKQQQQTFAQAAAETLGSKLDVRWNLTLAANLISAEVPYGKLDALRELDGVKEIVLEARYMPCVTESEDALDPNMATSDVMIGSSAAWANGLTGAGSRIAIIDTGVDTEHQSFDSGAFHYSLEKLAEAQGVSAEKYIASLGLLDSSEISSVLGELNASAKAEDLYRSEKIPFGYNYVDEGLEITHTEDTQGEHGSHVAGIASANSYIPSANGGYEDATESVRVKGVAPDAQLIILKVFGASGGAYESDYIAAIEDAIVLGADSINLSLGSAYTGFSRSATYEAIMGRLDECDTVVSISAGNAGAWADSATTEGYLKIEDISMATTGTPGTHRNSLGVASVDNIGYTGSYIYFGNSAITYTETDYSNPRLSTVSGEFEYIFTDGLGSEEEIAALGDIVEGKFFFCSRGTVNFAVKANNAANAGAAGVVVYNNTTGNINMDLSDYTGKVPVVSITQANANWVRENSTPVYDEDGNVLYYTGSLQLTGSIDSLPNTTEYYEMSYFSSWGVPSSLILKPEITAPGGNIYSVNGLHNTSGTLLGGHDKYENMSGTSMAAPQVAGMAAIVAQFIRENELDTKTGLSPRTLTQSLLMSTAEPMLEEAGRYYPVLRQGSGLANVFAATSADSYLLMDKSATASYADGKIKVELGDDPARTGSYTFSFSINNFADSARDFVLYGNFFTQAVLEKDGQAYMDTKTTSLATMISWLANGKKIESAETLPEMDFNGDGRVDSDDVQAILDYVLGTRSTLENSDYADLDGDGEITSYDAYLLLDKISTGIVRVEAGESVTVTVTVTIPESQKEALNESYPTGAYLEGYLFAQQMSSEEGVEGTTHSIPVLGFYGNWSEPSMYDSTNYIDYLYGKADNGYLDYPKSNVLTVQYPNDSSAYYYTINPYFVEETCPLDRASISAGSTLYRYRSTLIRNAGAVVTVITDQDGNLLYLSPVSTQVNSAYYSSSYASWMNAPADASINKKVSSLGVKEGDEITVSLVSIPEYYEQGGAMTADQVKALLESGTLGEGSFLSTTMTVDSTAPEILSISKDLVTGNLTVTAQDNRYIAMIGLTDRSGTELTDSLLPAQTEAGEKASVTFDLTDVKVGETCYVVVADYSDNQTVYEVEYGGEPEDYSGRMFTFTSSSSRGSGQRWMELTPEKLYHRSSSDFDGSKNVCTMDLEITAADYVDGYVYMAADNGYLYVAKQGLWDEYQPAGYFGNLFNKVYDMAYNYSDGKLYCLGDDNTIYSIGLLSGEFTKEFTVSIVNPSSSNSSYKRLTRLAIDDEGNFYSVNNGGKSLAYFFRWTLDDVVDGAVTDVPAVGKVGYDNADYNGSLAWDHDNDILYFANSYLSGGGSKVFLLTIDTETGAAEKVNTTYAGSNKPADYASRLYAECCALYIVPKSGSGIEEVETATGIGLNKTELSLLRGQSEQLTALVYPWTLNNKDVTWSSNDESIATVTADGTVKGTGVGSTIITATTVAEPHLSASCLVKITKLDTIKLNGLVYGANGNRYWSEFTSDDPSAQVAVSDNAGAYLAGTVIGETLYLHDGSYLYGVDADDFSVTNYGSIASSWIWSDATYAPATEQGYFGYMLALAYNGTILETVDAEAGEIDYWNLSSYFTDDPMAVISYRNTDYTDYSTILPSYKKYYDCPTQYYYVITESGELQLFSILTYDHGGTYVFNYDTIGQTGLDLTGVSEVTGGKNASMLYDQDTGYLIVSVCTGSENRLYAIDPETLILIDLGTFGSNGEKLLAMYQYDRAAELGVRLDRYTATIHAGDRLTLSAKVRPAAHSQNVVWSSSDETIATVDENGVVTAIKDGKVTITATSVDTDSEGKTASASCTITVKPTYKLDEKVYAQITTDKGAQWVTISTSDMSVEVLADATSTLTGAGKHGDYFYGSDSDLENGGMIYRIDPKDSYSEKAYIETDATFAPLDVTQAPTMQHTAAGKDPIDVFDMPFMVTNGQGVYFIKDDGETTSFYGYYHNGSDVSSYTDMAAIAYVGTLYQKSYGTQALFYVLNANGTINRLKITTSYTMRRDTLGKIDMRFDDPTALTMDYVCNGDKEGLIVGYNNAITGCVELYYIDLVDKALTCTKLGNVPNATSISGLTLATEQTYGTHGVSSDEVSENALRYSASMSDELGLSLRALPLEELKNGASCVISNVETRTQSETETAEDEITVRLTTKDATGKDLSAHNGLLSVRFDPKQVELLSVSSPSAYSAVTQADGSVRIVYACLDLLDTPVTLTFRRLTTCKAEISVTTEQVDVLKPAYVETITLSCLHAETELQGWKGVGCTEDGYTGDTVCCDCGEVIETGSVIPAHCASLENYTDVPLDAWYHDAVDFVTDWRWMQGMGNGTFAPNAELTRAQAATILYNFAGKPDVSTLDNPFRDVADGMWYTDAIVYAANAGVVNGIGNGLFAPQDLITREQFVTILYRYMDGMRYDDCLSDFVDGASVSSYAVDAMNWAIATGIIEGDTKGRLNPQASATRAEIATMIMRLL